MEKLRKVHSAMADAMSAHPKNLPLNESGQLVPDPIPMAPPVGYRPQPSMMEIIRDQVLRVSADAERAGLETEDQADDFDVGDEPEIQSPYELDPETEVPIRVLKHRAELAQLDYMEAKREAGLKMQSDAGNTPSNATNPDGAEGGAGGSQNKPPANPPGS